jgi:putative transposase
MARQTLIRTSEFPYHITARSNNRDFFYLDVEKLWKIFMEVMARAQALCRCEFHAFVLMSNHYHLLVSTPDCNIDKVMEYIQREVAKKANSKSKRINHFFGGPYKWSSIQEERYYWNAVKYIFRNPIRAGICSSVNEYKFSSFNFQCNEFDWKTIDFFNDKTKSIKLDIDWLNEPFMNESEEFIRFGLRRKKFKVPRRKDSYKHIIYFDTPFCKK